MTRAKQTYKLYPVLTPLSTTPLLTFALTCALMLFVVRTFPRWNFLDFPDRYGLKRRRLPYPTGIIAPIVFIAIFPLLQGVNTKSLGVLAAVILMAITCFTDDRKQLPPALRLLIQALAALAVVLSGDCIGGRICSVTNPFEAFVGTAVIDLNGILPLLSIAVTVVWLMLTTNALNWFDGIPGQTTALSTIGFLTIGFLSISDRVNQPEIAVIAFSLAAIAFASFLFDFPPPKVVLGDSGSMFFGLMLGILTVYAGGKVATAFLALGVPIIDLAFVILKRLFEGRSPFKGSMSGEHLHHRLLAKGWNPRSIIALTAGLGTVFGATALFLDTTQKLIAAVLMISIMGGLWIYSKKANKLTS